MSEVKSLAVGWATATVADIGMVLTGNTPSTQKPENYGDFIPFIKPPQLNNAYVQGTKEYLSEQGANLSRVLPPFSVLVSCIGNLGKIGINKFPVAFNQQINAIIPSDEVSPTFLFYQAQSHAFRSQLESKATATTISIVNKGNFETIELSIAPLPEQHRIVAKIEELFSELDKGVDSLKTAREQLKVYRQALLKHAFEGKLTAQWRAENGDKLETASALQQRIQTERQERHRQQLADWEAKGKQGSKPKAPKPLSPLSAEELAELPELPAGWGWVRPEEICAQEPYAIGIGPFGSNLKVSDYRESGIPLVFVKNITRSNFATDLKYIDEAKYKELQPHSVRALDLLITKMGDPPGDCEIYPEGSPSAVLTADCLKFRIWNEFADRKLYKFCINSSFVKRQLGLITRGVAQKKISVERFKTICLPLFSVEEQQVLIQQIDEKLSEADQLDHTLATALQQSAALRQSILKKAFCGQLVKQDKNDEPAAVLLERIRAEKLNGMRPGKREKSS